MTSLKEYWAEHTSELPIAFSFLVITVISIALGLFINPYFGLGMFIVGILIVIIPAIWFLKQLNKPDDKTSKEST